MLTFVSDELEQYAIDHTTNPGSPFNELAEEVRRELPSAGMMSGPTVGYLLNSLVFATGAKRVLEIGTFVGYSTLMMASALPDDGQVVTCDVDPEATDIARRYWAKSPHGSKIRLALGPALETMAEIEPGVDLVFIDADKENYPHYYERAMELLSPSGLIVMDNMLWGGRVLDPQDESDRAIRDAGDMVQADERVNNVMLTVRDGVLLIRKR